MHSMFIFLNFHISSRYLKNRYGSEVLPNLLMAVSQCINFLPTMAIPFRIMMDN